MQEALLSEYSKPEFQKKLRRVLEESCTTSERRELERELRVLREKVGTKFGFEATPEGVEKSIKLFTPELRADPEISARCRQMEILLYPQLQDELKQQATDGDAPNLSSQLAPCADAALSVRRRAELAERLEKQEAERKNAIAARKQHTNGIFVAEQVGRYWSVVGGGTKGGLVVRKGESLYSTEYKSRLATDSIVEELELVGDRLHYKKLRGDGPDFGWVSIFVRGATLLTPCRPDIKIEASTVQAVA